MRYTRDVLNHILTYIKRYSQATGFPTVHDSVRRVYAKLQYPCKMAASFRRNGCCAVLLRMKTNEGLNAFFNFVEENTTKHLAYAALKKKL